MLPKVEAALQFLEKNTKGSVLITSLAGLGDALDGKIGTLIKNWNYNTLVQLPL